MTNQGNIQICRSCGFSGEGNYCGMCGQPYEVKRISVAALFHDAFHLFTHLDKGFLLTVKMLIISPGHMQKNFIEGKRNSYQKPFSMFFICLTITALSRYWIFKGVHAYYHTNNIFETNFFHEYMVLLQILLLPVNAFITWLFFYKSGYNFAETGVLVLYTVSFFLLASTLIMLVKFFSPDFDTAYVELPVMLVYNAITCLNFFNGPRWKVALKSIVVVIIVFLMIQFVEDAVMKIVS